jgi:hypothetical protein
MIIPLVNRKERTQNSISAALLLLLRPPIIADPAYPAKSGAAFFPARKPVSIVGLVKRGQDAKQGVPLFA